MVELAAREGRRGLWRTLRRAWLAAETPQARRRFLLALAAFRDPDRVDETLALALDPRVPGGDVALLLGRALHNPEAREQAWSFVERRWNALSRRMGAMLVTRLIGATPALGTREARRDVAAFFRAHPVPTGRRAVRQALERFDLELALVRRGAPELGRFVAERPAPREPLPAPEGALPAKVTSQSGRWEEHPRAARGG